MKKLLENLFFFNNYLSHEVMVDIPIFIKYYLIVKVEILIIFFIIDLILYGLSTLNDGWYYKVRYKLANSPNMLIRTYKIHNSISSFISSISPKFIPRNKSRNENELINTIYGESIVKRLIKFIINLVNLKYVSTILALIVTIYIYYEIKISSILSAYFKLVNKDNLLYFLTILPAIITIIIVFVGWKFTSLRGRYDRSANRLNEKIIEETLDMHRRLIEPLFAITKKGAENVDYAITCKDLLLECRIRKISPFIKCIDNNKVIWVNRKFYENMFKKESFLFDNIDEIDDVAKIINEAIEKNIFNEVFWIRYYSKGMFGLNESIFHSDRLQAALRSYLFTQKTVNMLLKEDKEEVKYQEIKNQPPNKDEQEYFERQILKDIDDFNKCVEDKIVSAIEILVDLSDYNKAAYKLLHFNSNRFKRTLNYWTDRE